MHELLAGHELAHQFGVGHRVFQGQIRQDLCLAAQQLCVIRRLQGIGGDGGDQGLDRKSVV